MSEQIVYKIYCKKFDNYFTGNLKDIKFNGFINKHFSQNSRYFDLKGKVYFNLDKTVLSLKKLIFDSSLKNEDFIIKQYRLESMNDITI